MTPKFRIVTADLPPRVGGGPVSSSVGTAERDSTVPTGCQDDDDDLAAGLEALVMHQLPHAIRHLRAGTCKAERREEVAQLLDAAAAELRGTTGVAR